MCAEHGVLEALCTKHHPALVAVFQAKGDWCGEHGFPESICPSCHPERGGRPAARADDDVDDGPADGTIVTLKGTGAAARVGIETTAATSHSAGQTVSAVARIGWDASRVAVVNAPAAGLVRELRVDVGVRVRRGQTLAVIDSADVGADRGRLVAAQSRLQTAQAEMTRAAALFDKGIAAQKVLRLAQQNEEIARAEVVGAEAALGAVGGGGAVSSTDTIAGGGGRYVLTSPLTGVVVRREVSVGQSVERGPVLFEIVDASMMWAELEIAERDLAVVREGQEATLLVDALPEQPFVGVINSIAPRIDPRTRTAAARIALKNPDGVLRASMYGTARVDVGVAKDVVLVPSAAVQRAGGVLLVFVKLDEHRYEAHRVQVGDKRDGLVEVKSGIAVGDDVVTTGAFLLKTETLQGAIGAGCCE